MRKTSRVRKPYLILTVFLVSQIQPLPYLAAESIQPSINAGPVIPEISAAEVSQITNPSGSLPVNALQGSLLPAGPLSPAESLNELSGSLSTILNAATVPALPSNTRLVQRSQGVLELVIPSSFEDRLDDVIPSSVADDFEDADLANVEFAALLSALNEQLADFYDFVAFFPTQNVLNNRLDYLDEVMDDSGALAFGAALKNDIMGIGTHTNDPRIQALNQAFGPYFEDEFSLLMTEVNELGPQQGTGFFDQKAINNELPGDAFRNFVFLQEMGHRWGTFLSSGGDYQANPLGILGRDRAHWGSFFDGGISPMDGMDWKQNFTNTFELDRLYGMDIDDIVKYGQGLISTIPQNVVFNDFDLYAMGLLAKEQVQPSFVIQNPTRAGQALNEDNFQQLLQDPNWLLYDRIINGTKKTITIDDIIAIEGQRNPSSAASQKNFNIAFVILKSSSSDSTVTPVRGMVDSLAANVSSIWSNATKGLSTMTAGPIAGAADSFKDRILQVFDQHKEPIDAGALSGLNNEVETSENNQASLADLESLWTEVNNLYKSLSLLARSPSISGLFGNISAKLLEIQTWIADFEELYEDELPDASEIIDTAFHSDDLVASLVNQVSAGGILPVGFYAYLESLIEDYNSITPVVMNEMAQNLSGINQDFLAKFTGYENFLQENQGLLSSLKAPASVYDPNAHSVLPNMPNATIQTGYYASTSSRVKSSLIALTHDGFDFTYDVYNTSKGFVIGEVDFGNHPGELPELFTLGLKGPAKGNAKMIFVDDQGNKANFVVSFTGVIRNYQFDFSGGNVSAGFDRTQIKKIQIQIDQKLMTTSSNYKGYIQLRTEGLDYKEEINPYLNNPGLPLHILPNRPTVSVIGGNDLGIKPYGKVTSFDHFGDGQFWFGYDVEDSIDSNVFARINFEKAPGYLPEQFMMRVDGPSGSKIEVKIVDIYGHIADFELNLEEFNVFVFNLLADSITPWFDRNQISHIDFKISGRLANYNKTGVIGVSKAGLTYRGYAGGSPLDANLHTVLSNTPSIVNEEGRINPLDDPGEIESFSQISANHFKFRYALDDPTSYVTSSLVFNNGPGILPEVFALGVKGPNEGKLLVRIVDENGNFVEFLLRLFGILKTYKLDFGNINQPWIGPYPFDRDKIARIDFIADAVPFPYDDDFLLGENDEGTIEILTAGLKYP